MDVQSAPDGKKDLQPLWAIAPVADPQLVFCGREGEWLEFLQKIVSGIQYILKTTSKLTQVPPTQTKNKTRGQLPGLRKCRRPKQKVKPGDGSPAKVTYVLRGDVERRGKRRRKEVDAWFSKLAPPLLLLLGWLAQG